MTKVYVAGPLFSAHERQHLETIAMALEQAGYATFLPHRDAGLVTYTSDEERMRIFELDIEALDDCDVCVAALGGPDHDSGTSAELGYMFAKGKACFGIRDDKRPWTNNIIWGICGGGKRIFATVQQLLPVLPQAE